MPYFHSQIVYLVKALYNIVFKKKKFRITKFLPQFNHKSDGIFHITSDLQGLDRLMNLISIKIEAKKTNKK